MLFFFSKILSDSGEVFALGYGEYGQLGLSGLTSTQTLQKIKILSGSTQVATGSYHSVALTSMVSPTLTPIIQNSSSQSSRLNAKRSSSWRRSKKPLNRNNIDTTTGTESDAES